MYDEILRTTTRFEWEKPFDEDVIYNKEFVRLVGEVVLEDVIDGKEVGITLLQVNVLHDPAYYTSIVMRFCVEFHKYSDWIQAVVICNYDTVLQQVVVNLVHSCSRSECIQLEASSSFILKSWKYSVATFFYNIIYSYGKPRVIHVRGFLVEDRRGEGATSGPQTVVTLVCASYPCYLSQTDRGLTLL